MYMSVLLASRTFVHKHTVSVALWKPTQGYPHSIGRLMTTQTGMSTQYLSPYDNPHRDVEWYIQIFHTIWMQYFTMLLCPGIFHCDTLARTCWAESLSRLSITNLDKMQSIMRTCPLQDSSDVLGKMILQDLNPTSCQITWLSLHTKGPNIWVYIILLTDTSSIIIHYGPPMYVPSYTEIGSH